MTLTLRRRQWIVAGLVVGGSLILALAGWWPFDAQPHPANFYGRPTLAQVLLSDRLTLGAVRLAIVALAGFLVASVLAQIVAGRWLKRLPGTGGGGMVDEPTKATEDVLNIKAFREKVDELTQERDDALAQLDKYADLLVRMSKGRGHDRPRD